MEKMNPESTLCFDFIDGTVIDMRKDEVSFVNKWKNIYGYIGIVDGSLFGKKLDRAKNMFMKRAKKFGVAPLLCFFFNIDDRDFEATEVYRRVPKGNLDFITECIHDSILQFAGSIYNYFDALIREEYISNIQTEKDSKNLSRKIKKGRTSKLKK